MVHPMALSAKIHLHPAFLRVASGKSGFLIFGRDPRVADVHEAVLSLISCATKLLIYKLLVWEYIILNNCLGAR